MSFHHFFRMAKWARNPPSDKRVKLVLAIIAVCIVVFLIERYVGWPEALTVERLRPYR